MSDELTNPEPDWLQGDRLQVGLLKNKPEFREDLRWYARRAGALKMSQKQMGDELGISASNISKVFSGQYIDTRNSLVLAPPAKMLSRIRVLRDQEAEAVASRNQGRVMTPTVEEVHRVCRKVWKQKQIGIIYGESHIGKTEALEWFRDENNHGATLYVDLQDIAGVQDLYKEFAYALKLSGKSGPERLKERVINSIDGTNLILVDEVHHITHAYRKGSAKLMVNALKSIKDRTGCAMVLCMTHVGRHEFEDGEDARLLGQLRRRGSIILDLGQAMTVGDVRAIVEAYGLEFPPAKRGELWKKFEAEYADLEHISICRDIAWDRGAQWLINCLHDGQLLANKTKAKLTWATFVKAHKIYLKGEQPRAA
ncbi:MAG: ATP-binding protein [Verrucomicrobiota bacterium]